jgi:hypothetical protein
MKDLPTASVDPALLGKAALSFFELYGLLYDYHQHGISVQDQQYFIRVSSKFSTYLCDLCILNRTQTKA